jgi:hypothetical protein
MNKTCLSLNTGFNSKLIEDVEANKFIGLQINKTGRNTPNVVFPNYALHALLWEQSHHKREQIL